MNGKKSSLSLAGIISHHGVAILKLKPIIIEPWPVVSNNVVF